MELQRNTDIFNKNANELLSKHLFLFDMDGTIYSEEHLFDGVLELMNHIEDNNGKYVFITNNSSKSVSDYIKKLNTLGIKADITNFFTSAQATILYLKENYPGSKIYCQGTNSMLDELRNSGISVTTQVEDDVSVVLVGFDTELTSDKLRNTCELLYRNIPFIATNPDLACPVKFGFIPDCGSICNMLTNATGKKPVYIGKPNAVMVEGIRKKLGYTKEDTVIIGDRLYTDIATGINAKVTSIAVLTGEATLHMIKESNIKPTFTFNDVNEIYELLKYA